MNAYDQILEGLDTLLDGGAITALYGHATRRELERLPDLLGLLTRARTLILEARALEQELWGRGQPGR